MAVDDPESVLDQLRAIQQARVDLDRRERQLVRWARKVQTHRPWRTARNAAGLGNPHRPIRCHHPECPCSIVRKDDGTLDRRNRQHIFTWAEIAAALGISRQAAQKRHRDIT